MKKEAQPLLLFLDPQEISWPIWIGYKKKLSDERERFQKKVEKGGGGCGGCGNSWLCILVQFMSTNEPTVVEDMELYIYLSS